MSITKLKFQNAEKTSLQVTTDFGSYSTAWPCYTWHNEEIQNAIKAGLALEDWKTAEEIKEADVVILAVDIAITGTERFEGKPTIKVPTNVCVKAPKKLIEKIENELGK